MHCGRSCGKLVISMMLFYVGLYQGRSRRLKLCIDFPCDGNGWERTGWALARFPIELFFSNDKENFVSTTLRLIENNRHQHILNQVLSILLYLGVSPVYQEKLNHTNFLLRAPPLFFHYDLISQPQLSFDSDILSSQINLSLPLPAQIQTAVCLIG